MPDWMVPVLIGFGAAITYTLARMSDQLDQIARLLKVLADRD